MSHDLNSTDLAHLEAALAERLGPGLALTKVETSKQWEGVEFHAGGKRRVTIEHVGEMEYPVKVNGRWERAGFSLLYLSMNTFGMPCGVKLVDGALEPQF